MGRTRFITRGMSNGVIGYWVRWSEGKHKAKLKQKYWFVDRSEAERFLEMIKAGYSFEKAYAQLMKEIAEKPP
jgi:hypothetical protein